MHGGLWVEFLRPLIRHQRLVHLVLAQFREVALELRQVVVPRVLAHVPCRTRTSRSHFLTFKATLTLHSHSHFLF